MTLIFCVIVFIYFTADSFTKQHLNIFMIFFIAVRNEINVIHSCFIFFTLHSLVKRNQIAFET